MKTIVFNAERASAVKMAGKIIRAGGLVAMPTETVYGLAANALDERAVERIFKVKGRPQDNPLIVHVAKFTDIEPLCRKIPDIAERLIEQYWPGPLTLVFKKSDALGHRVSAGLSTVAIRCPSHPAARRLIESAGCPLAAPSANLSGKPSPTTADHVLADLEGRIEAVLDGGACEVGVESTVLDITGQRPLLLRPGGISEDVLRAFLPDLEIWESYPAPDPTRDETRSPGLRHRHYAPRAPLCLLDGTPDRVASFVRQKSRYTAVGALCFRDEEALYEGIMTISYGDSSDSELLASELFEGLRELDSLPAKQLYARLPEGGGLTSTVRDRLCRAASGQILNLHEDKE